LIEKLEKLSLSNHEVEKIKVEEYKKLEQISNKYEADIQVYPFISHLFKVSIDSEAGKSNVD